MKGFKKIVIVAFFLLTANIYSQDDTNDFSTWFIIGAEYELNKKWDFGLEQQLRLKNNSSEVDKYFTQLSGDYKLIDNFKLGGALRYIRENDNQGNIQGYENHFRFNIDATYKHKLEKLSIGYRLRYQNKNEMGVSKEEGDYANQNIRLKTSFKYKISKWPLDPKFSAEIFNRFQKEEENGFNKYRLTIGTDYKIKNFGKITLFYRYEKEINTEELETTNILALKYIYSF